MGILPVIFSNCQPVSEAQYKICTSLLAPASNFTSEQSERLHKRLKGATSQARLPEFGEDVKKTSGFSEELLFA